jgi:hypothetical protein
LTEILKPCDIPGWRNKDSPSSEELPLVAWGDPPQGRPIPSPHTIASTTRPNPEPSTADADSLLSAICEADITGEPSSRLTTSPLSVINFRSASASIEPRILTSPQDNTCYGFNQPITQGEKVPPDPTESNPESTGVGDTPPGSGSTPALSDSEGHPPAKLPTTLEQCDQGAPLHHQTQLSVQCRVANCKKVSLDIRSDQ